MVFQSGFTARVFREFLTRLLERQVGRPVFLIVDGHPVHKARAIQVWLARPGCRITLYFLPGYSPELNPDELLNHDVKSHIGRHRPRTRSELLRTVRGSPAPPPAATPYRPPLLPGRTRALCGRLNCLQFIAPHNNRVMAFCGFLEQGFRYGQAYIAFIYAVAYKVKEIWSYPR
jgi:hypothetical protein